MEGYRFRALTIPFNGDEPYREEGRTSSLFGDDTEQPISRILPIHIFPEGGRIKIALDNPLRGGPVCVCGGGVDEALIPGESRIFQWDKTLVVIGKVEEVVQMILLEKEN